MPRHPPLALLAALVCLHPQSIPAAKRDHPLQLPVCCLQDGDLALKLNGRCHAAGFETSDEVLRVQRAQALQLRGQQVVQVDGPPEDGEASLLQEHLQPPGDCGVAVHCAVAVDWLAIALGGSSMGLDVGEEHRSGLPYQALQQSCCLKAHLLIQVLHLEVGQHALAGVVQQKDGGQHGLCGAGARQGSREERGWQARGDCARHVPGHLAAALYALFL
mmetsp:Transcript_47435/g.121086  ORF Transcript_47435/g.121086 Transcript_47435/m.121086 type:complete len:218 (-) Transcript_47435:54-707(-)